jgi:ATP-dependent Clp protease ATP-binding subunit ClpB
MTSNIGSEYILENKGQELVLDLLKKTFRPEFLNRVDEIIIFNALNKNIVSKIIDKLIKELEIRLSDNNLHIELTDKAMNFIIDSAYDVNYGVRPLKRFISRNIETLIAKSLIEEKIKYGDTVIIDESNEKIILR